MHEWQNQFTDIKYTQKFKKQNPEYKASRKTKLATVINRWWVLQEMNDNEHLGNIIPKNAQPISSHLSTMSSKSLSSLNINKRWTNILIKICTSIMPAILEC